MTRAVRKEEPEVLYDGSTGSPAWIAYDPGGVTGWAMIQVHPLALQEPNDYSILENVEHFSCGQFAGGERQMTDQMLELALAWPGAPIVIEDFILRQFNQDPNLLSPVRLTAMFRYAIGPDRRIFKQQPALAMSTMTDERLEAIGYLERTRGLPHARDAVRHLFTFGRRLRDMPAALSKAFPALAS